jgi:hypothetical protein
MPRVTFFSKIGTDYSDAISPHGDNLKRSYLVQGSPKTSLYATFSRSDRLSIVIFLLTRISTLASLMETRANIAPHNPKRLHCPRCRSRWTLQLRRHKAPDGWRNLLFRIVAHVLIKGGGYRPARNGRRTILPEYQTASDLQVHSLRSIARRRKAFAYRRVLATEQGHVSLQAATQRDLGTYPGGRYAVADLQPHRARS